MSGRFFGEIWADPYGAPRFHMVLCLYVSVLGVIGIAIGWIAGEDDMGGAIRCIFE
jgi:hypothetical protein